MHTTFEASTLLKEKNRHFITYRARFLHYEHVHIGLDLLLSCVDGDQTNALNYILINLSFFSKLNCQFKFII